MESIPGRNHPQSCFCYLVYYIYHSFDNDGHKQPGLRQLPAGESCSFANPHFRAGESGANHCTNNVISRFRHFYVMGNRGSPGGNHQPFYLFTQGTIRISSIC